MFALFNCISAVEATARANTPPANLEKAAFLERIGKLKSAAKKFAALAAATDDRAESARLKFRQAECLFKDGEFHDSYEVYEDLLENYPMHAPFGEILERLRDLAERFARGEGVFLGVKNRTLAADIYEAILGRAPTGPQAAGDTLRLAQLQAEMNATDDAVFTYRELLKRFPKAKETAEARLALGRLLLEMSGHGDGDGSLARQARNQLETFIRHNPKHERRDEADLLIDIVSEKQAMGLYDLGEFYQRQAHRRLPASRRYLHDVLREYPKTTCAVLAQLLINNVGEVEMDTRESASSPPAEAAVAGDHGKKNVVRKTLLRPEDMTPERLPDPKIYKPLGESQNPKKWLVPLEDLNQPDTGDDAK